MRDDMQKVIVERPRVGSRGPYKHKRKQNIPLEDLPTKQSMKHDTWDRRSFNEHLAPLYRFLNKSIGRNWNDVYSEICENIKSTTTLGDHVRQHVWDKVYFLQERVEPSEKCTTGLIGYSKHWHAPHEIRDGDLYVDENNILQRAVAKAKAKKQPLTRKWRETNRMWIGDQYAAKRDGIWYWWKPIKYEHVVRETFGWYEGMRFVPLEGNAEKFMNSNAKAVKATVCMFKLTSDEPNHWPYNILVWTDPINGVHYDARNRVDVSDLKEMYDKGFLIEKNPIRQLNTKELKKHGLKNS